ncbi:transport protein Avl9-domain-containing protein [Dipodascopsis uninucleata]
MSSIDESYHEQQTDNVIIGVCVVGFHHTRGPEVEYWVGENADDHSVLWPNLPFQSLPDGSHSHEEDYSYFTLLYESNDKRRKSTTYFGISCNRQIRATELLYKSADVTRSTVQKSVVVVATRPIFGPIREKLAVVTRAYFLQGNFEDRSIINNLYDNLRQLFQNDVGEADLYNGMTLRELVHRFKWKTLVLFKALILEPRILFFGSNTELLCSSQFSLVSLIPGLIDHLEDSASPTLNSYEMSLKKSTSLKSSDRSSLLAFMGLPLQVFGKGGMFNPYCPLQQLEALTQEETKFYLIGSTNSLLLSQKHKYADILVNVDDNSFEILNPSYEAALQLTHYDRRWIDSITQAVNATWPDDIDRSDSILFSGSEDYIRWQFEDYLMALLASVKYDGFLRKHGGPPPPEALLPEIDGNPATDFNMDWVDKWKDTNNYRIFQSYTDEELFDVVEPRHLSSGGISLEEVQRKVAQQVQNLAPAKETITKTLTTGSQKVSAAFGNFWAEIDNMREKERLRKEAIQAKSKSESPVNEGSPASSISSSSSYSRRSQHITTGATDNSYLSSWTRWAIDKRRALSSSDAKSSSRKSSGSGTMVKSKAGISKYGLDVDPEGVRRFQSKEDGENENKRDSDGEDEDEDNNDHDYLGEYVTVPTDGKTLNPWKTDDDEGETSEIISRVTGAKN